MAHLTDQTAPHEISFEAYGAPLRLAASSPELLERLEALLPPYSSRIPPDLTAESLGLVQDKYGTYAVFKGGTPISEGQRLEHSLVILDGVLRSMVAVLSPHMTFVHAGAVAHEGRGIVFPGHSFAGKTTLTAAMVRAGATYLSDEFAVLDRNGLVHPYPKPLSLRVDRFKPQVDHPVEHFGGVAADEPVPVGLVVLATYRPGAQWRPTRLSPGNAIVSVLANTVIARTRPAQAMSTLRTALEDAVTLQGERGEADEIVGELLQAAAAA